jgi:hypothetical protein
MPAPALKPSIAVCFTHRFRQGPKKKKRELSEDAAYEIALQDHPEWRRALENDSLPDEIAGPDGQPMSPRMHLMLHVIVERQLAADDPKGVVAIAEELAELGVSGHDIRHEIGRAVCQQMWQIMKKQQAFDERQYFDDLREIVDTHR